MVLIWNSTPLSWPLKSSLVYCYYLFTFVNVFNLPNILIMLSIQHGTPFDRCQFNQYDFRSIRPRTKTINVSCKFGFTVLFTLELILLVSIYSAIISHVFEKQLVYTILTLFNTKLVYCISSHINISQTQVRTSPVQKA